MSSSVIERDPYEQKAFGQTLIGFESDMRTCCKTLKGHIQDAQDTIQADNAAKALNDIVSLIEEIESCLPDVGEFGTRQMKLAQKIIEAQEYHFTRH